MFAKSHGGRGKRPQPYARPWTNGEGVQRIGSGAIPISEFDSWYYSEEVDT